MDPMEILLARLLGNPDEVEDFLKDREMYARDCGVEQSLMTEILDIDAAALRFAALGCVRKRRADSG
jgi:hypothetical protein